MSIIIGADFVPTNRNITLFNNGNINDLVGDELYSLLSGANYRVFNLEMPLVDEISPISKCGPNLSAPTSTVRLYKNMHISYMTLANNHIMDQGSEGLFLTIKTLQDNGVSCFGAGNNINEASKPIILDLSGKKIGFYGCVEHEFSVASDNVPGANPFDTIYSYEHVAALKTLCDYVVVLYHGGKEFYRYPSPILQKICRRFAEVGADLIICQHSHCIGCEEKYNNSTIIYGQGNFLFDHDDNEYWNSGLLVELSDDLKVRYIPVVKVGEKVRLPKDAEKERILEGFYKRSHEAMDTEFIWKHYKTFALCNINRYLLSAHGISKKNVLFRIINKLTGYRYEEYFIKSKYGKNSLLCLQNFIECEAQRELFIEGLKALIEGH